MAILMAGPAIDGTNRIDLREVPEADYDEYIDAGFRIVEDVIAELDIGGLYESYSYLGTRYASARLVSPSEGAADGENLAFVFESDVSAVTVNGIVVNPIGTIDGDTFTFNEAPQIGDEIKGLIGVIP